MIPEPPIGWRIVEASGHWWHHREDGDWRCSCGDAFSFEWPFVVDDIGRDEVWRCTLLQVGSSPES